MILKSVHLLGESDDSESEYDADSGNESSGDDLDLLIREEAKNNPEHAVEDNKCSVMTVEEILDYMVDEVNEVKDVVQLSSTAVRLLLNYFHWDKGQLLERLYDTVSPETLFREAGLVSRVLSLSVSADSRQTTMNSVPSVNYLPGSNLLATEECEICFTEQPKVFIFSLDCGHRFCKLCWCEYLTTKIMDEGIGDTISCAAYGCHVLVSDTSVLQLITSANVVQRYKRLITNNFVLANRCLSWCPSLDCEYAVRVSYPDQRPVTCQCGRVFCFLCSQNWHEPISCKMLKRWLKKCADDSETFNWIAAHTKECPKCNVTIEKDGGCNHVVCKSSNCRAEFCWVCLGPWAPHASSWYNCNKYDESEARAARDAQQRSRTALNRYLFYFNRYSNHMQSMELESKLYGLVKQKMHEMQLHNMSWIEVQFLTKAVDILFSCRQTLMYTYVFAYYTEKNNQTTIFEANQKDLENSTETLSEYLERNITQENMSDLKQRVQDKYRYCEHRRKVLLEHVHEGYDSDWWRTID